MTRTCHNKYLTEHTTVSMAKRGVNLSVAIFPACHFSLIMGVNACRCIKQHITNLRIPSYSNKIESIWRASHARKHSRTDNAAQPGMHYKVLECQKKKLSKKQELHTVSRRRLCPQNSNYKCHDNNHLIVYMLEV